MFEKFVGYGYGLCMGYGSMVWYASAEAIAVFADIWGLARVYFKYNVKFVFKSIPCVVQQNVGLVPVCRSAKILAVVSCECERLASRPNYS